MIKERVLVTGGAGYVGSVLVPKLISAGLDVKIMDWMIFGRKGIENLSEVEIIEGDIRNEKLVRDSIRNIDYVIHLAAIANDPCSNLNHELTKQVNLEASQNLVLCAKKAGVKRFVYASSSSVYGIRNEPSVTEDLELMPLTIYSQTKADAEKAILNQQAKDFHPVCIRSATICGYSPRQRLDLIVNILASDAILKGEVIVNGGEQKRPNVHIEDITNLYTDLISLPENKISGQIFNFGKENHTVNELAELVREVIGENIKIKHNPKTSDSRSYHISSEKIEKAIGEYCKHSISDAIRDLRNAFTQGLIPNPENSLYRNIARMKELKIQ